MRVIFNWIILALWLRFIFGASGDGMSAGHTSRFLFPFLRWLVPGISMDTMDMIHFIMRKGAHMTEYAILYLLSWRAFGGATSNAWTWNRAVGALLFVALFAASDEFHQSFVPSREASVRDVALDVAGGLVAFFCIWLWKGRDRREPMANEAVKEAT